MFRSDLASAVVGAADVDFRRDLPQSSGSGAFSALFSALNAEISDYIENGSSSGEVGGLNASGGFQRARLQALAAEKEAAPTAGDFAEAIAPLAREAAQKLGVAPDIIAAQAALESGWGQRPLRRQDGSDSHNLFGLKAGGGWQGDSTTTATTEYENGTAQARVERFRSYPDKAAAFSDFANLLLNNPRYRSALNTGNDVHAYAQGLVRGGYATDPAYADKLARVLSRLHSGD